jgi:hypothetical protein
MVGEYSGNIYNIFDFKIGSFYGLIIYNLNLIIYSVARTIFEQRGELLWPAPKLMETIMNEV